MKIPSILTNEDIESYYEKFNDESLNLPRGFKILRLGLLPRICQFFITILKLNPNVGVKFFQLEDTDDEGIRKLIADPHSLAAILMAEKVFGKDLNVNGKKQKIELKAKINQALQLRLNESIHKKGHRLQLFAVDHSIAKYAYPICFYSPEGTTNLKQSSYYTALIERFIESTSKISNLSGDNTNSLGELIFELIENTDHHGKLDYESGKYERSVRALVIDYKLVTNEQISSSIGGKGTAITDYLEGIRATNRTVHLLEISLFDSGTGIANNLGPTLEKIISNIDDEVMTVSASFAKGITSKLNNKGYGRGLHNVRKVLSERNGFLAIRTGRVGLFRDFDAIPLIEKDDQNLTLYDETNKTDSNFKELKTVEGLACSILVPLK